LFEQKILSLTSLEQWYSQILSVGELPSGTKNNPRFVLSKSLIEDAKDYSSRNKYITETELGRFMKDMGCIHKSNGKAWGWIFLPLDEARARWIGRVGGHWEWLAPDISEWGDKPRKD